MTAELGRGLWEGRETMRLAGAFFSVLLVAVVLFPARPVGASRAEYVYVIHADSLDRQAIVERSNGEQYLIEVGVGCLSLQFAEGDTVVIVSPGMFAGIGSRLVLPDRNQDCRILRSERIDSARPNPIRARGLREDAERAVIEAIPLQMQTGSPGNAQRQPSEKTVQPVNATSEGDGLGLVVMAALVAGAVGWFLGRRKRGPQGSGTDSGVVS